MIYWVRRCRRASAANFRRAADRSIGQLDRLVGFRPAGAERGSSTVEFVIILPVFLLIFMVSFETSMIMSRQVMLERGMDLATREIRLDSSDAKSQAELRQDICDRARILPDCIDNMRVQLQRIDRTTYLIPDINDPCTTVDGAVTADSGTFDTGRENEMFIIRACFSVQPVLARFGLGGDFIHPPDGRYYLISGSVVMVEPVS